MIGRFLVTGGAGFIGCNIVRRLIGETCEVRVLDNFSTGDRDKLPDTSEFELIEGDLTDYHVVQRAVSGIDYVLHQGALTSTLHSISDPTAFANSNILGTLNVLKAAQEANVKRVIFASSASIYGDSSELPLKESAIPSPNSPYAATKLAGESLCQAFHKTYGLETVILRYFNIFGPYQDPRSRYSSVIPRFVMAGLSDLHAMIYGNGLQSRDFTFVDDVVEANLAAASAREECVGRAFNVGCGQRHTLLDLLETLESVLGVVIKREHRDPNPGDVEHSLADIDAARACLDYEPNVGFREGLERTVSWFQKSIPFGNDDE
ncbi:NAD-dependent epimerase/dehydratase family protein [Candidatus Bipolaricaulota bacterium]